MAKNLLERVYAVVKRCGSEPLSETELMRRLNLPMARRKEVKHALRDLLADGRLARAGKDGFVEATAAPGVSGRLVAHPDGFGFVVLDGGGEDVFVPRHEMGDAMHGDRVSLQVGEGRDGRSAGHSLRVLERGSQTLVGRLERLHQRWAVVPLDGRQTRPVLISASDVGTAREGDLVQVRLTGYPERGEPLSGVVELGLGDGTDATLDSPLVLAECGIDPPFPPEALAEAARLPQTVTAPHREGREDLRNLPTVTIDGETAKDFDDAVSWRADADGASTLWVHIADVDAFAPVGSALDMEARERATSVYLPDMVVPMFPEALSNGICSLNPETDRCTLTAEMQFNAGGHRTGYRIYTSVIRSDARLTYTGVNRMLVNGDTELQARYAPLLPMLRGMEKLARQRMAVRKERGSLDFDLPETLILLGIGGEIRDVLREEREIAHRLIEEFMLIANETVAEWLTSGRWPCVYRVHEDPDLDKINAFVPVARNVLGPDIPIPFYRESPPPKTLQWLLGKADGHPAEHVLNSLLIRSLKQARYTGEHLMHYGLAAETYCHFTSPIRRYPDLMVHRLVRHRLAGGDWRDLKWTRALEETAIHASSRERRAMGAERRVTAIKKCRFLSRKVGEAFEGIISSVARFGMFVEISEVGFDGLVPVENLPERVTFDDRHMALVGKTHRWQIGDMVRAQVVFADPLAGRVTLELEEAEGEELPPPPGRRPPHGGSRGKGGAPGGAGAAKATRTHKEGLRKVRPKRKRR